MREQVTAVDAGEGEQAHLPRSITVDEKTFDVWPDRQSIEPLSAPLMALTRFADHTDYHGCLTETIYRMERDPAFRNWIFKGGCGMKVRDVAAWREPASDLIHARALTLAHRILSNHAVFTDASWASIYRQGDYCAPHSHLRSNVSIVYMLDAGDDDAGDPMAGRLCFADPRIPYCCPHEPGRVTSLLFPEMTEGTMVVFASDYLHSVAPYRGTRPRVTLSWNIAVTRLPGRAGEGWSDSSS